MLFPSSFSVLPLVQPLPSACSLAAAHGWKRPTVGQRRGCSSSAANPPTANSNSQQPAASSAQPTSRRQHSFPRARLLHACASLLSPPFARLATAPLATAAWSWSDFPPPPTTLCFVLVGASPRAARGVDDHAVEKPPGTVAVTQPKTPWGKKEVIAQLAIPDGGRLKHPAEGTCSQPIPSSLVPIVLSPADVVPRISLACSNCSCSFVPSPSRSILVYASRWSAPVVGRTPSLPVIIPV